MKKIFLTIMIISSLLVGCNQEKEGIKSYTRVFTVVDIQNEIVSGKIDENMTIDVPLDEFEGEKVKVGDVVTITYDYVLDRVKKIEIKEGK